MITKNQEWTLAFSNHFSVMNWNDLEKYIFCLISNASFIQKEHFYDLEIMSSVKVSHTLCITRFEFKADSYDTLQWIVWRSKFPIIAFVTHAKYSMAFFCFLEMNIFEILIQTKARLNRSLLWRFSKPAFVYLSINILFLQTWYFHN